MKNYSTPEVICFGLLIVLFLYLLWYGGKALLRFFVWKAQEANLKRLQQEIQHDDDDEEYKRFASEFIDDVRDNLAKSHGYTREEQTMMEDRETRKEKERERGIEINIVEEPLVRRSKRKLDYPKGDPYYEKLWEAARPQIDGVEHPIIIGSTGGNLDNPLKEIFSSPLIHPPVHEDVVQPFNNILHPHVSILPDDGSITITGIRTNGNDNGNVQSNSNFNRQEESDYCKPDSISRSGSDDNYSQPSTYDSPSGPDPDFGGGE